MFACIAGPLSCKNYGFHSHFGCNYVSIIIRFINTTSWQITHTFKQLSLYYYLSPLPFPRTLLGRGCAVPGGGPPCGGIGPPGPIGPPIGGCGPPESGPVGPIPGPGPPIGPIFELLTGTPGKFAPGGMPKLGSRRKQNTHIQNPNLIINI